MTKKLSTHKCLLALFLLASTASASTMTFNVAGKFQDGTHLGGSFTVDETAGTVIDADFNINGTQTSNIAADTSSSGGWLLQTNGTNGGGIFGFTWPKLFLYFPVTTLVDYAGGSLCTVGSGCAQVSYYAEPSSFSQLVSGSASAAAPEPGTPVLIGFGMIAMVLLRTTRRNRQSAGA
jgi:hypothetical protein